MLDVTLSKAGPAEYFCKVLFVWIFFLFPYVFLPHRLSVVNLSGKETTGIA